MRGSAGGAAQATAAWLLLLGCCSDVVAPATAGDGGPCDSPPWTVTTAASTATIRRDFSPHAAGSTLGLDLEIDMAQNERESGQIVIVASLQQPARNVSWSLRAGGHDATKPRWLDRGVLEVDLSPFGAVHQGPCPFDARPEGVCPPEQPFYCARGITGRPSFHCQQNATRRNSTTGAGCVTSVDCCEGCSFFGSPYFDGGERGSQGRCSLPWNASQAWYPYPLLDW